MEGQVQLQERINKAERDELCAWRALWLVSLLAFFSICGICYSAVLIPEFFQSSSHVTVKFFYGLGLASLVCAVAFLFFWLCCRGSSWQCSNPTNAPFIRLFFLQFSKKRKRSWSNTSTERQPPSRRRTGPIRSFSVSERLPELLAPAGKLISSSRTPLSFQNSPGRDDDRPPQLCLIPAVK